MDIFPKNPFRPAGYGPILEKLIKLANICVVPPNLQMRYQQLGAIQTLIVKKVTPKAYVEAMVYRVIIAISERVWDRPYRLGSSRDLTPNERESYKFLAGQVNYFGLNNELLEGNLATIGERGSFTNPMSLFKRMTEMLRVSKTRERNSFSNRCG